MPGTVAAGSVLFCRGVTKAYATATGDVTALRAVDADVPTGRLTVIRGASGSGKSTLLRILACADRPTTGSVVIDGLDVALATTRARRRLRRLRIGYVHQQPAHNLIAYLGAADQLRLSAALRGVEAGAGEELLDAVGLARRAAHLPHELSGGEQQRLAFAAAAVGAPSLVVADEPTAELDRESARLLMAVVADMAETGMTLVLSSHDDLVVAAAHHVVTLEHGRVVRTETR